MSTHHRSGPDSSAESPRDEVMDLLRRITRAWLDDRPRDLEPLLHPDVVMALPGFVGRAEGRGVLIEGFVDFCANARVLAFEERDHQVDVVGGTAVASFSFVMVYERDGRRYRSSGRDFWVFGREEEEWLALWRTMLDVTEEPE